MLRAPPPTTIPICPNPAPIPFDFGNPIKKSDLKVQVILIFFLWADPIRFPLGDPSFLLVDPQSLLEERTKQFPKGLGMELSAEKVWG